MLSLPCPPEKEQTSPTRWAGFNGFFCIQIYIYIYETYNYMKHMISLLGGGGAWVSYVLFFQHPAGEQEISHPSPSLAPGLTAPRAPQAARPPRAVHQRSPRSLSGWPNQRPDEAAFVLLPKNPGPQTHRVGGHRYCY